MKFWSLHKQPVSEGSQLSKGASSMQGVAQSRQMSLNTNTSATRECQELTRILPSKEAGSRGGGNKASKNDEGSRETHDSWSGDKLVCGWLSESKDRKATCCERSTKSAKKAVYVTRVEKGEESNSGRRRVAMSLVGEMNLEPLY